MFEWKDEPEKPYNLINHVSDWDGTLRSYKATHAIRRFQPNSAGQIARIWIEEANHPADVSQVQFPMFLESEGLVDFVNRNTPSEDYQWRNYYLTHWDLTDSVADMWKLSHALQKAYPTKDRWFQGVNIGMGWQDLLKQVRTIFLKATTDWWGR